MFVRIMCFLRKKWHTNFLAFTNNLGIVNPKRLGNNDRIEHLFSRVKRNVSKSNWSSGMVLGFEILRSVCFLVLCSPLRLRAF